VDDFNWQVTWRQAPGDYTAGPTYLGSNGTLFGKQADSGTWQTTRSGLSWSAPQEIGNFVFGGTNPGAVDRGIHYASTAVDVFQRLDGTTIAWSAYR
jgi:hypothetical protein